MFELFHDVPLTEQIGSVDYLLFSSRFEDVIRAKIPTAGSVRIVGRRTFVELAGEAAGPEPERLFDRVCLKVIPEKVGKQSLLLPLPYSGTDHVIALVSGLDAIVAERASADWLREISTAVAKEIIALKKMAIEPVTSLYNGFLMRDVLAAFRNRDDVHLVLAALLPRARTPKETFNHVKGAARALQEYNRQSFALFHLGQGIFAIVIVERPRDFLKSYCLSLLTFLKRKGFKRIHCGSSSMATERPRQDGDVCTKTPIIDEAWFALHEAGKRGPFAFCDYDFLVNPSHFPLKEPAPSTVARLRRLWKNLQEFSLVFFRFDQQNAQQHLAIAERYLAGEKMVATEAGLLVIRPKSSAQSAREWAKAVIEELRAANGADFLLTAGVCSFPFRACSKTDMVRNCQKALVHADFFGPGSVVVFDAVSLNISGDLYFAEGDLAGAVREYRRGLELDEYDTNLHNSLGVTYALMNRSAAAQAAFRAIIDLDPENFMAFYNLGLGEQAAGRFAEAAACFSKALAVFNPEEKQETQTFSDLQFQLGVALYHIGNYRQSIDILHTWYENQADDRNSGKGCRYIGIGNYHLGHATEAITWLQRGLTFDEFDAESLNLLGELYLLTGQGDEIALRLCEKSVEIDGGSNMLLLRYARVLTKCGYQEQALTLLRRCARSRKLCSKAWYEMAVCYFRQGKNRRAGHYLNKLADSPGVTAELKLKARELHDQINQC